MPDEATVLLTCGKSFSMADIFYFSGARRHTRCSRDWSSDVCSSDLGVVAEGVSAYPQIVTAQMVENFLGGEIGRASCRERVWCWALAGGLKENDGALAAGPPGAAARAGAHARRSDGAADLRKVLLDGGHILFFRRKTAYEM